MPFRRTSGGVMRCSRAADAKAATAAESTHREERHFETSSFPPSLSRWLRAGPGRVPLPRPAGPLRRRRAHLFRRSARLPPSAGEHQRVLQLRKNRARHFPRGERERNGKRRLSAEPTRGHAKLSVSPDAARLHVKQTNKRKRWLE